MMVLHEVFKVLQYKVFELVTFNTDSLVTGHIEKLFSIDFDDHVCIKDIRKILAEKHGVSFFDIEIIDQERKSNTAIEY